MRTSWWSLLAACGNDIGLAPSDAAGVGGPPGSPMVSISSPRANEAYYPTQTVTITWTATDEDSTALTCDVVAITDTGEIGLAQDRTATSGQTASASWPLTGVIPATYQIRVSCGDANGLVGFATSGAFIVSDPPQPVSYSAQIQPLWTASCVSTQCHDAQAPAGGVALTATLSYGELYDVTSQDCSTTKLVDPGAPDQSYLVHKLQGSGPCFIGTRMPKGMAAFSAEKMKLVRDWIVNGAPNN